MTTTCDIICARCSKIAATFTAYAAGEGVGLGVDDKDRLLRTVWAGTMSLLGSYESAVKDVERLRAGEIAELQRRDWDTYAFFCRRCAKPYCSKCWTWGPPEYDEGFYDCTRGTCPENHTQTLDD